MGRFKILLAAMVLLATMAGSVSAGTWVVCEEVEAVGNLLCSRCALASQGDNNSFYPSSPSQPMNSSVPQSYLNTRAPGDVCGYTRIPQKMTTFNSRTLAMAYIQSCGCFLERTETPLSP
jgi:hypothetical protein